MDGIAGAGAESAPPTNGGRPAAALEPLTAAEVKLLSAARRGDECHLSDRAPVANLAETEDADGVRVRAAFLRALLLSADDDARIHESGLRLSGALIEGRLNLAGGRLHRSLALTNCRFTEAPVFVRADTLSMAFDGSIMPGFYADRATIRGSLYFRSLDAERRLIADDSISLVGAVIESDLRFRGGRFAYGGRLAKDMAALIGARRERLDEYAAAVSLQKANVGGTLDLREMVVETGAVDLALADVHTLKAFHEDVERGFAASAPQGEAERPTLILDGFVYRHMPIGLAGDPEVLERFLMMQPAEHLGVASRRKFLADAKTPEDGQRLFRIQNRFRPQPFEQTIQVLRAMGYEETARRIAVFKQERRRRARGEFSIASRFVHWWFGATAGYGYRPSRAILCLAALWLIGAGVSLQAYRTGGMAPANAQVLIEDEWRYARAAAASDREAGLDWSPDGASQPPNIRFATAVPGYARFDALAYSADRLIPFVELGQDDAWGPEAREPWGQALHYYDFAHTALGWILSALAIAGVTGIVQRF